MVYSRLLRFQRQTRMVMLNVTLLVSTYSTATSLKKLFLLLTIVIHHRPGESLLMILCFKRSTVERIQKFSIFLCLQIRLLKQKRRKNSKLSIKRNIKRQKHDKDSHRQIFTKRVLF
ncbi:BnaCnng39620D [Brassica napus]|uniref:BnaCnng39620D protein n=1 Tax=Brassica napus TaxID=3708 RepID=A0A078J9L7_BRANA|nr:BnaCnng39620D [Brassica napus]